MSTHLLLFLLLISLYPYACTARHHGLFHTISHKGAEKVKYTMLSSTTTEKPKELEPLPRIMDEASGITKGVVRTKSLVAVSWKIPHEKYAEDPRFDLDYAPPRIHPPSHN